MGGGGFIVSDGACCSSYNTNLMVFYHIHDISYHIVDCHIIRNFICVCTYLYFMKDKCIIVVATPHDARC